jgi:peptidoglycan/LPS O-acetylase OafA/YrhL
MAAAPRTPVEIPALTGLRGILALWVLLLHMAAGLEVQGFSIARHYSASVAQVAFSGGLAVDGFFILSGFILSLTHAQDFTVANTQGRVSLRHFAHAAMRFWLLRLARIYPMHAFALALFVLALAGGIQFPIASCGNPFNRPATCDRFALSLLAEQLTLTASWGMNPVVGWNFVSWSICSEWFVYLFFPVLALMLTRVSGVSALAGATLILCAMWIAVSQAVPHFHGVPDDYGLLRAIPEFVCGALLYRVYAWPGYNRVRWPAVSLAAVLALPVLVVLTPVPTAAVFALAMLVLALASNQDGAVNRLLSARFAQFLGRISYSLYITHLFVLEVMGYVQQQYLGTRIFRTAGQGLANALVLTILALTVAALCHKLVEVPARRGLRALLGKPSVPAM